MNLAMNTHDVMNSFVHSQMLVSILAATALSIIILGGLQLFLHYGADQRRRH